MYVKMNLGAHLAVVIFYLAGTTVRIRSLKKIAFCQTQ